MCDALSEGSRVFGGMLIFVTDFGQVRVSEATAAVMDAQFPGWYCANDLPKKTRAQRDRRNRARRGAELLWNAVKAIDALAYESEQSLEAI